MPESYEEYLRWGDEGNNTTGSVNWLTLLRLMSSGHQTQADNDAMSVHWSRPWSFESTISMGVRRWAQETCAQKSSSKVSLSEMLNFPSFPAGKCCDTSLERGFGKSRSRSSIGSIVYYVSITPHLLREYFWRPFSVQSRNDFRMSARVGS